MKKPMKMPAKGRGNMSQLMVDEVCGLEDKSEFCEKLRAARDFLKERGITKPLVTIGLNAPEINYAGSMREAFGPYGDQLAEDDGLLDKVVNHIDRFR